MIQGFEWGICLKFTSWSPYDFKTIPQNEAVLFGTQWMDGCFLKRQITKQDSGTFVVGSWPNLKFGLQKLSRPILFFTFPLSFFLSSFQLLDASILVMFHAPTGLATQPIAADDSVAQASETRNRDDEFSPVNLSVTEAWSPHPPLRRFHVSLPYVVVTFEFHIG
jgi:hypothetical protein